MNSYSLYFGDDDFDGELRRVSVKCGNIPVEDLIKRLIIRVGTDALIVDKQEDG